MLCGFAAVADSAKPAGVALIPKSPAWRAVIALGGFALLVALAYAEEDWRGKHAWDHCKQALEARGEDLTWNDYIPPPVPDDRNFFKAPKMAEWFTNSLQSLTNGLARRLANTNAMAATLAELTVLPPSTQASDGSEPADVVLRYSSFGAAVFPEAGLGNPDDGSPVNPIIELKAVPLASVIENLARRANLHYSLDANLGRETTNRIEPLVSVRWENLTARQALLALLNQYGLQLVEEPAPGTASITRKAAGAPRIYAAPATREKITGLFQNAVGPNAIAAQDFALLVKSLNQIRPVRMILHSEQMPAKKAIVEFFTEFFPNDSAPRGTPRIRVESTGTNSFRVICDSAAAADYLAWSDRFEADFNLIRQALKRSDARMEGSYADPYSIPLPNFTAVRAAAQTSAQRAQCDLLLGRPEKALDELTLLHDLRRSLEARPAGTPMPLWATMLNVAVVGLYTDTIADGMRLQAWHEPQLAALQKQLDEIDLPPFAIESFHEERAGNCLFVENQLAGRANLWQAIKAECHFAMPHGWLYQNLVHLSTLGQKAIDSYDPVHAVVRPGNMNDFERELTAMEQHYGPYTFLAAMALPHYARALQVLAHNQTLANEAQIVCALERYHLAHGEYPDTLNGLVPQFIGKLPPDLIGGQPLHYRRAQDPPSPRSGAAGGNFLLYSVGWDETDNGGQEAFIKTGVSDYAKGDWVWQYPLK